MSHDCQHIRELMDSYLSGELSVETNHRVLHHLGACEACAAEAKRRERLRALLAHALDVPVDVDRVRQRVTAALDREPRSWRRGAPWWSAAAAVIVGIAAAYWLSKPVDASAYDDSAGNHIACALTFPPTTTYDPARAARSLAPLYEGIAEAVGLSHGPYRVIDAHMCPYQGRDYAHVVLRGEGQTLSLFVEPAVRGALPAGSVTRPLPGEALDVHSAAKQGYRVSAVATPKHQLFLVAEQPTDAPEAIANEILRSAVRFVRSLER